MARPRDPMMTELKKLRREISGRLRKAERQGPGLLAAMRILERKGLKAFRELTDGLSNGRSRRRK